MSYYAIRFASAPDHIRIEKAEDPRTAHRRAFGPFTKMTRWEWKDLGKRVGVIRSDNKRIALLTDPNNWHKEGPATDSDSEGE